MKTIKILLITLALTFAALAHGQTKVTAYSVITDTVRGLTAKRIAVKDTFQFTDGSKLWSAKGLPNSLGTANQFLGVNSGATAYEYKTFATGTSGTNFTIDHSVGGITFNLPTASASNTGKLSSADWSTFNAKESALTFSTGLTRSVNTITSNLSTGISGGQSVIGGTAASEILTLSSTSHGTKGKIAMGTSFYDEVNNRLGLNVTSPTAKLSIKGSGTTLSTYQIYSNNSVDSPTFVVQDDRRIWMGGGSPQAQSTLTLTDLGNTSSDYALAFKTKTGTFVGGFLTESGLLTAKISKINGSQVGDFLCLLDKDFMLQSNSSGYPATGMFQLKANTTITTTANNLPFLLAEVTFAPTSAGSNTHTGIKINQTINQSGGHAGVTRGLWISSTVIAAADWKAIEINRGNLVIDTGSIFVSNCPASTSSSDSVLVLDASTKQIKTQAPKYNLSGSATLDFPNTPAQQESDLTITVTGAALSDVVSLGVANGSTTISSCFTAWVSASNTVTVRFLNVGLLARDPASGTFKVIVWK